MSKNDGCFMAFTARFEEQWNLTGKIGIVLQSTKFWRQSDAQMQQIKWYIFFEKFIFLDYALVRLIF